MPKFYGEVVVRMEMETDSWVESQEIIMTEAARLAMHFKYNQPPSCRVYEVEASDMLDGEPYSVYPI